MFRLPPLPYAYDALQPVVSAETMHAHHDKHHAKYIDTLNTLLGEKGDAPEPLETVVRSAGEGKLYNNAAQAWNHAFFWDCMTPGGAEISAGLRDAASQAFGDWDTFRQKFIKEGETHFASGWNWVVARDGAVEIVSTHDAGSFDKLDGATPLLVCDVWEHAYYLDHKSDRKGFLERWFDELANWSFAERQLAAATGSGEPWRFPDDAPAST